MASMSKAELAAEVEKLRASLKRQKAKAGRLATLASRTNTLLSLPMLTSMAMYQTLFG